MAAVLVGGLAMTGATLALLSPAPLMPDISLRLYASTQVPAPGWQSGGFESVFVGIEPGRWRQILVRHSGTPSGNAQTLADQARQRGISGPPDHFVIGLDGEIQVTGRWTAQQPAASLQGMPPKADCISICLIGDFSAGSATPDQRERLAELIEQLQQKLGISAAAVLADAQTRRGLVEHERQ